MKKKTIITYKIKNLHDKTSMARESCKGLYIHDSFEMVMKGIMLTVMFITNTFK